VADNWVELEFVDKQVVAEGIDLAVEEHIADSVGDIVVGYIVVDIVVVHIVVEAHIGDYIEDIGAVVEDNIAVLVVDTDSVVESVEGMAVDIYLKYKHAFYQIPKKEMFKL